jgi:hypothetical protein
LALPRKTRHSSPLPPRIYDLPGPGLLDIGL